MIRFTIRDLLWLTFVAALAVGWWAERKNSESLRAALASSNEERLSWRSQYTRLEQEIDNDIQNQLKQHGLQIIWMNDAGPVVSQVNE